MTLEAIKEAIQQLPPEQQSILTSWLRERDLKYWDDEIEHDFAPGGRGMPLLAELKQELAGGGTHPLSVGLAQRRK